jgi:phosphoadenosine phosphosulfate reductase
MSRLRQAKDRLIRWRAEYGESVNLGLSGKDSIVCLDLAVQVFKHVECFHMYFVKGLTCVERPLNRIAHHYGVKLSYVPHWDLARIFKFGILCNPVKAITRQLRLADVERSVMARTNTNVFCSGIRAAESMSRRLYTRKHDGLSTSKDRVHLYPIWDWLDGDVYAYLKAKRLPLPPNFSTVKKSSGMSFTPKTCEWLATNHPEDWQRVLEVFPYAEVQLHAQSNADPVQVPKVHHRPRPTS